MRRYPVVGVLVAAGLIAGVGAGVAAVNPRPSLPAISAPELVASTLAAITLDPPVSGQLLSHVDLGIPSLPAHVPQSKEAQARLFEALNGEHRIRYWNSPDGVRISELLPTAELSFIAERTKSRAEAWAWDSRSYTAIHFGPAPVPADPMMSPAGLFDPVKAVRETLSAISPTTRISLPAPERVAGRDAYVLRIEPRTTETLIGRIDVSIDAERRLPLRVAVFARGASKPTLSLEYTSIQFGSVDPGVYRFSPPPDATVIQAHGPSAHPGGGAPAASEDSAEYVRTFGQAWTIVIAYRLPAGAVKAGDGQLDLRALLPFSGALFSARLVDRPEGPWLMLGAVPQSRLAALEPQLP